MEATGHAEKAGSWKGPHRDQEKTTAFPAGASSRECAGRLLRRPISGVPILFDQPGRKPVFQHPELERYPWCGHAGFRGGATPTWHDRTYVLAGFGPTARTAVRAVRRGREAYAGDEHILGASAFGEQSRAVGAVPRRRALGAAYLPCRFAGESGRPLAAALGVSHQAVYAAATRGERTAVRRQAVWRTLQ